MAKSGRHGKAKTPSASCGSVNECDARNSAHTGGAGTFVCVVPRDKTSVGRSERRPDSPMQTSWMGSETAGPESRGSENGEPDDNCRVDPKPCPAGALFHSPWDASPSDLFAPHADDVGQARRSDPTLLRHLKRFRSRSASGTTTNPDANNAAAPGSGITSTTPLNTNPKAFGRSGASFQPGNRKSVEGKI